VQTLEENLAALYENGHVRDEEVLARMHTRMLALEGACDISAVVCCSVLQCVAVCCSVLQCVAVCCSLLHACILGCWL